MSSELRSDPRAAEVIGAACPLPIRERDVVARTVADDPGHPRRRTVPVYARGGLQVTRCVLANTRVIVVEHIHTAINRVRHAADTRIARA